MQINLVTSAVIATRKQHKAFYLKLQNADLIIDIVEIQTLQRQMFFKKKTTSLACLLHRLTINLYIF